MGRSGCVSVRWKVASMRKFKPAQHLVTSLSILPAVMVGLLILRYGVDLIDWDQWEVAAFFEKASHGTLTLGDLFAQQAEYRQFFPNLIFVSLGWLTHWNIKYEMLLSLALACVVAFNIHRLSQVTFGDNRSRHLLLTIVSSLLIFAPAQFENWLLGEQIIYFMPVVCLTTCLRVSISKLQRQSKLIICMLLSTVSTFSSANGIVCWIVVPFVLLLSYPRHEKKKRDLAIWIIGFALNVTIYFYNFRKPAYTPGLAESLYHPLRGLFFFCAMLGAPLVTSHRLILVSTFIGAILASLFLASCWYVLKFAGDPALKRGLIVWLMLGAYSFITAIIVTVARLGFGTEQAVNSRYTTFSIYLLVSLCYLLPLILDDRWSNGRDARVRVPTPRLVSLALSVLILLHAINSVAAIRQMRWMKIRRLQAKACLLFINSVPDRCLSNGFPGIDVVRERANAVNDLGFLRPGLINSRRIEDLADNSTITASGSYGSFEDLSMTENAVFVAAGWARLPDHEEAADTVLLTYQQGESAAMIFALAEMRIEQRSFAGLLEQSTSSEWRWQISFPLSRVPVAPPVSLSAWAFDATTGKAYKLNGTFVIENE